MSGAREAPGMNPASPFGPWVPGIDPGERTQIYPPCPRR
jgi:hypothetical protein